MKISFIAPGDVSETRAYKTNREHLKLCTVRYKANCLKLRGLSNILASRITERHLLLKAISDAEIKVFIDMLSLVFFSLKLFMRTKCISETQNSAELRDLM